MQTPPSSSGPGRGPLKAQTGVRVPLGASNFDKTSQNSENVDEFVAGLLFEQRGKLDLVSITNSKLGN
jgi:hypothetical protein